MYTLEHYVRYSTASDCHFVHDSGTVEELGLQYDHYPIQLDRKEYRFNTYHYTFGSLGAAILNDLNVGARLVCPGVMNPTGLFIRTAPLNVNLLTDVADAIDESKPALPYYDWDFNPTEL